jgi:hypothetical protein
MTIAINRAIGAAHNAQAASDLNELHQREDQTNDG